MSDEKKTGFGVHFPPFVIFGEQKDEWEVEVRIGDEEFTLLTQPADVSVEEVKRLTGIALVNLLAEWQVKTAERFGVPLDGAALITAERKRQQTEEGWTADHDDIHVEGELVAAAVSYAAWSYRTTEPPNGFTPKSWPWELRWWKPKDQLSNLIRAGALIAAEIDRLRRRESKHG